MKNFTSFFRTNVIEKIVKSFTFPQRIIFGFLLLLMIIASIGIITKIHRTWSTPVPIRDGKITEGIIGTPRFIHPLLTVSDADEDITTLLYSGLMKKTADGHYIPDLAESYSISPDGLEYTFSLRKNISFDDGHPITSEDIAFTIEQAKNPLLKSMKSINWQGVEVSTPDVHTVIFQLRQPYAGFLENTTLGILPRHIWENIQPDQVAFSDYTVRPVGSGPFRISSITKNASGIPESYTLISRKRKHEDGPFIKKMTLRFYTDEESLVRAFRQGKIDTLSLVHPAQAEILEEKGSTIYKAPFARVFGLFFNGNQSQILLDQNVRRAINIAIDREKIINEVLLGFGTPLGDALPLGMIGSQNTKHTFDSAQAKKILDSAGYKMDQEKDVRIKANKEGNQELTFAIATSDTPELISVANTIQSLLAEIGIKVEVKVYDLGTLQQEIIRPRKYDALLFGQTFTQETDLFAFWHSSQRNDPGLNISLYANTKVDTALEKMLGEHEETKKQEYITSVLQEINKDIPAIFIYSPYFLYINNSRMQHVELPLSVTQPKDRFRTISSWYLETHRVWNIFPHSSDITNPTQ